MGAAIAPRTPSPDHGPPLQAHGPLRVLGVFVLTGFVMGAGGSVLAIRKFCRYNGGGQRGGFHGV